MKLNETQKWKAEKIKLTVKQNLVVYMLVNNKRMFVRTKDGNITGLYNL